MSLISAIPSLGDRQQSTRSIDLNKFGYPAPPCDYLFQDRLYPKRHIEFLDSGRLLVSFPVVPSCNKPDAPLSKDSRFHSVVLDTFGKTLGSFQWGVGQNVQAGPDGNVLVTTKGRDIQILDAELHSAQDITWLPTDRGAQIRPWLGDVILAPSRHGFIINTEFPEHQTAYFEGNPAKETIAERSCPHVVVMDGGFGCWEGAKVIVHSTDREWSIMNPILQHAQALAFPTPKTFLIVTDKFQLYQVIGAGGATSLADLRWLAPGWNAGFRYDLTSASAQRVLFFSHGARFPISDTNGFGKYLRVGVLDLASRQVIFREQYALDSDVAISPDGHLLAVREKTRLNLVGLP